MASSSFCIIFIFLFYLPFSLLAQSTDNIGIGTSMTAGDGGNPWLSASGDFAFGFRQLDEDNEFLLSIWYDKIPPKTVVWHANISRNGMDNPVLSKGSMIRLDAQGGLVLTDPSRQRLWSTDVNDVARVVLNDTGNLMLISNKNTSLWESFQHPTDTLLPSQVLEIGGKLISRRSETNFTQGRFYIAVTKDGEVLGYTKSRPSNIEYDDYYYYTGTTDDTTNPNPGVKVVFDETPLLYIQRRNNQTTNIGSRSGLKISDYYHRVTLDFDGVLTQYYYQKYTYTTWTAVWTLPDNICTSIQGHFGSGACGYNSICSIDNFKRPICRCPDRYSLVDSKDEYSNCQPDFSVSCDGLEKGFAADDIFDFQILRDVDFPFTDFQRIYPSSEAECKNACLKDCFCVVAIYRSNSCWKKKMPLSYGRTEPSIDSKVFMKYRKDDASLLKPGSPPQSNGNIAIGASLTAGDENKTSWLSASGDFAFGFKKLEENEFLLSIWYDKIQQKTVVWHSIISINGIDNPVVSKGSTIRLDAQDGLTLTDPRGQILWSTAVNDVARGVVNDTGNLVLVSNNSTSLWESFQHPADTRKLGVYPEPKVGEPDWTKGNSDGGTFKHIVSILLASSVFINCLLIGTICLGFYNVYKKRIIRHSVGNIPDEVSLRCFTYQELDEATNGFKEELGRGAFGIVYKGVMSSGSTIAVKKLDSVVNDTEKEFRTEVNVIGQTHHKNLVRLIGFCDAGQNRLLVYEYMSNGTLASFLSDEHRPSWSQHIQVAQGIASVEADTRL